MGFFESIKDFITRLKRFPKKAETFFKALWDGMAGTGLGTAGAGKSLWLTFLDIGWMLEAVGDYVLKYLDCAWTVLTNLRTCFFSYLIWMILSILTYFCLELPVLILEYFTGWTVHHHIDEMWKAVAEVDGHLHDVIGFHLMQFSEEIVKECFTCSASKIVMTTNMLQDDYDDMTNRGYDFHYDFTVTMPGFMETAKAHYASAKAGFADSFDYEND